MGVYTVIRSASVAETRKRYNEIMQRIREEGLPEGFYVNEEPWLEEDGPMVQLVDVPGVGKEPYPEPDKSVILFAAYPRQGRRWDEIEVAITHDFAPTRKGISDALAYSIEQGGLAIYGNYESRARHEQWRLSLGV